MPTMKPFVAIAVFTTLGASVAWAEEHDETSSPPDPPPALELLSVEPSEVWVGHVISLRFNRAPNDSEISKLRLYLDGRAIGGLAPTQPRTNDPLVEVPLEINGDNLKDWRQVLEFSEDRRVTATVGVEGGSRLPGGEVVRISPPDQVRHASVGLFVLVLLCFGALAFGSNMLRNSDLNSSIVGVKDYAASLGRVQMAWWFFITMGSAIYVWLYTGSLGINDQVFLLIGISAATGLGAVMIDQGKQAAARREAADAASEAAALPSGDPKQPLAQDRANSLLAEAKPRAARRGFWIDMLSDSNGVSFHRFQMLAWTAMFGAYYLFVVWQQYQVPELDPNWLALMGVSSAGYLGFKLPEKRNS